ncbi:MAG: hypothetical protein UX30_C0003G0028 [Candidatus Saccharibacteria bacterium GW2011_GWA2_46_10]|nr:MAG: hypothetical protein UX30_C0003G0028 [Candidatus Saccharibacteria bacterium GW2011_GWA2_46_10]OGL36371.1 MAG: hypothetical protein A3F05_01320 [Candidatus Saccharibacteria bacterium RIFCSPHIGHO2_12_FULL_47_17]
MVMKLLIARILTGLVIMMSMSVWAPTQVFAIDCNKPANAQEALQCGASGAAGQDVTGQEVSDISAESGSKLSATIKKILNVLSAIVAIVAVIMIVIGGFRYVASAGKQENVTAAKNTILYAIIGLIVVALAQAIVHFVLREATEATSSTSSSNTGANAPRTGGGQ